MEQSVRFMLSEHDKRLLETIAGQNGDASMSATLRLLIRQEAAKRNIYLDDEPTEQPKAEEPA